MENPIFKIEIGVVFTIGKIIVEYSLQEKLRSNQRGNVSKNTTLNNTSESVEGFEDNAPQGQMVNTYIYFLTLVHLTPFKSIL